MDGDHALLVSVCRKGCRSTLAEAVGVTPVSFLTTGAVLLQLYDHYLYSRISVIICRRSLSCIVAPLLERKHAMSHDRGSCTGFWDCDWDHAIADLPRTYRGAGSDALIRRASTTRQRDIGWSSAIRPAVCGLCANPSVGYRCSYTYTYFLV